MRAGAVSREREGTPRKQTAALWSLPICPIFHPGPALGRCIDAHGELKKRQNSRDTTLGRCADVPVRIPGEGLGIARVTHQSRISHASKEERIRYPALLARPASGVPPRPVGGGGFAHGPDW